MPLDKNELATFNRLFATERLSFSQQLMRSTLNIIDTRFAVNEQEKSYQEDIEAVYFFLDILKKNDFDCEKTIAYIGLEEIEKLSIDFLNQYLNKITEKLNSPAIYIHSANTQIYCSIIHSTQTLAPQNAWSFYTLNIVNMLQTFLTHFQINKAEIVDTSIELLIEYLQSEQTKYETENTIFDQPHNCHKISIEQLQDFLTNKSEAILQESMHNMTNTLRNHLNLVIYYYHTQKLTKEETVERVRDELELKKNFPLTEEYVEDDANSSKKAFREIHIYYEQKKIKPKF